MASEEKGRVRASEETEDPLDVLASVGTSKKN